MPKVTAAIRIDADTVLDLTNPAAEKALSYGLQLLVDADWRADNAQGRESLPQALETAATSSCR